MGSQELVRRAAALLDALGDVEALERAYSTYIEWVLGSPKWSSDKRDEIRIPWQLAREAAASPSLNGVFRLSGLYLFGSGKGTPRYWGKTGHLKKRLFGRYVGGKRSQCQLALDYEHELKAHGIDGFPPEVREWYRRGFGGSTVRLDGAVDFAQQDITEIWFTVLPLPDDDAVRPLERALIPVAQRWNRNRGYPPLMNRQDT